MRWLIFTLYALCLAVVPAVGKAQTVTAGTIATTPTTVNIPAGAKQFMQIWNEHASQTVACAFAPTVPAINGAGSFQLAAAGGTVSFSWQEGSPGFSTVPTGALSCIGSGASTTITVLTVP